MDELFPVLSGVVLGIVVAGLRPSPRPYQRNADFATQTLLGTDNTSPVDISIDPFFVRYTPPGS
jgi:hypothetical protein